MKSKNITLLALSLFIVASLVLAGCAPTISEEEFKTKLVAANSNINSYTADTEMVMTMEIEAKGTKMSANYEMESKSQVDRKNKALSTLGQMTVDMFGQKTTTDIEAYYVNGYLYTKTMGIWTKMKFGETELLGQQDTFGTMVKLLENSKSERLNDESGSYVIKMTPNVKEFVEATLKDQQLMPGDNTTKFAELIESTSVTFWVDKESFVVNRYKTEMTLKMEGKDMGPEYEALNATTKMTMTADAKLSEINKEFTITLPSEASSAADITEQILQG